MTKRIETLAVHGGGVPDAATGAVNVPIYQTSTYAQRAPGEHTGFEYARTRNPTRDALESSVAALEGGRFGLCFASGCAATDAVLHCLSAGDHVVAADDLYGGTFRLFHEVHRRHGIDFTFVPAADVDAYARAIRPDTRLVWLETPTNPLLAVVNLDAVSDLARRRDVPVCVDNTFATPYLQRPLEAGATLVVHSVTKYLAGHADVVGGAVVTDDPAWNERLAFVQNSAGAVPGPFDCFLALRGIKTLAVRVDRQCDNAEALVEMLVSHEKVERVVYPGLTSHPQHDVAARQMKRPGAMVTFVVKGGLAAARRLLTGMELFTLAESLGGVESLIEHPAIMTHASVPPAMRAERGISDGLIRVSAGIEHVQDLKDDLSAALDRA